MDNLLRLSKEDWLRAARLALLHHGPDGVRVEPLARQLGVTKGSFYWHFTDRKDLLETLLEEWEEESSLLLENLGELDSHKALQKILDEVKRRTLASEKGEWPSDIAIFAWAGIDPDVAKRVNRTEEERMGLLRNFAERPEMADFFYYAYQGLLLRRRRIPKAVKDFDMLAKIALEIIPPKKKRTKISNAAKKAATTFLLVAATSLQGCSLYRTLRWQDPPPNVQDRIFPQRIVHHAAITFHFARAANRNDLDTVSVRNTDGKLEPFAQYLIDRSIRAFVVIRNDTIVYERYRDYKSSDRWSSFSVAKSVTSAVLGEAIQKGVIGSFDDPVTRYLPELASDSDFSGLTIRHLMQMTSGFSYVRADGSSLVHDLRSSDAKFYYTTDRTRLLSKMHRKQRPPAPWSYKDSDVDLIGWILTRAARKSVAEQLENEVWKKIGTQYDASFNLDSKQGLEDVAAGFNATVLDYARFARLYLHGGSWNGEQILPSAWVKASTTLDTTRTEPDVTTWYRMQHNDLWWLPMHNWASERDFYADGSRGQRVYVHPPTNTIIVQLANDSEQDFPFRKVAHYLAGESYEYPRGIVALVRRAIETEGIDAATALFRRLSAEERIHPERYFINRDALGWLRDDLRKEGKEAEARAVSEMAAERYGTSR